MIQRIQSLFLFLAMLLVAGLFVGPITQFNIREVPVMMEITGFSGEGSIYNSIAGSYWFPLFTVMTIALIALLAITLFSYKNRPRQIRYCAIAFFLNIVLLGLIFLGPDVMASKIEPALRDNASRIVSYRWPSFLPFISLVLINLASRFIKKDEALVRSADRLR